MSDRPEAAMVFAAGRGVRMRPLSDVLPKPALPLPDGPVVGWALRLAAATGVRRVAVNTWHLAARMEAAVRQLSTPGLQLSVSREPELLGTGGGLAAARDLGLLGHRGPVLVVNGDGVLGLDLGPLLARHGAADDLVTLALLPHLAPRRWSRVHVDPGGRVTGILPPGDPAPGEVPLLYPGVMMVSRPALAGLGGGPSGVAEALWRPALAAGRLGGVVVSGYWREVGTPADYLEAVLARVGGVAVVDPTARVDPGATLSSSFVGRDSTVEAGAVVERSIVVEGAVVGTGARVRDSILLGRLVVDPDVVLAGAVLAALDRA